MKPAHYSLAEAIAVFVTGWLALAAISGYLVDAAGFGVQPWLAAAIATVVAVAGMLTARVERSVPELAAWAGVVGFGIAVAARLAWPSLLPPGRGPDLTHHLLLVDYIERHGSLVHDRSLDGSMGEMAHYTPGSHLLAVMSGRWFGSDGLHAFFPLTALAAALTAGFVFLIARRHQLPVPYAVVAAILLLLPSQYFLGAFTHDAFLAQTVSTLFAVTMWWAMIVWDGESRAVEERSTGRVPTIVIAVMLVATFLTWPIWMGPPLLVFLILALGRLPRRDRWQPLAIVLVPFALVAFYHAIGRWQWLVIVRASGAVLSPSVDSLGWLLPALALLGVAVHASDPRRRVSTMLIIGVALQTLALYTVATIQGADTPYMAFKMFYLVIYPLAVFAAIAIARAARQSETAGWLAAAVLLIAVAQPALSTPRPVPVVDTDLHAAGRWLRANLDAACADYLVADPETAYWLHLAVLGNPRVPERMKEIDTYDPRAAIGRWITTEGRNYAIADLRLLPDEVRTRVEVKMQAGDAAVIARPDATIKGCD
ncbi:MAG TPA: hypothetical protein VEC39_01265 [Vicinamibacterales bacterium]|nr:hypothetical protein [Vicinamibacterales bacterium]